MEKRERERAQKKKHEETNQRILVDGCNRFSTKKQNQIDSFRQYHYGVRALMCKCVSDRERKRFSSY